MLKFKCSHYAALQHITKKQNLLGVLIFNTLYFKNKKDYYFKYNYANANLTNLFRFKTHYTILNYLEHSREYALLRHYLLIIYVV